VTALLASVGTREPEHPAPDLVSVPVADDVAMTRVVSTLANERIAVTELSLRLPSLDEVFYSLTGRTDSTEGKAA
jgi:oleandomycin transport system ATP-binding protein